jgi:hypothetical protein
MDGVGYPTFQGFQTDPDCEADKDSVYPGIDFFNGGFDIICSDSIDARGDVNVNGVPMKSLTPSCSPTTSSRVSRPLV